MEVHQTSRGFSLYEFTDRYGAQCSLQKSSIATEACIWFGVDDGEPRIMASQAAQHGVETMETTGWVDYPLPDEVLISTRMHLTQDQVRELLPILQLFVDTGELTLSLQKPDDEDDEIITSFASSDDFDE